MTFCNIFLIFPRKQDLTICSSGDDLQEMSNPVSGKNKQNIINLSSVELAWRVIKLKFCTPTF